MRSAGDRSGTVAAADYRLEACRAAPPPARQPGHNRDADSDATAPARLTIDNVDRAIITSLRNIGTTPAGLLIEIVTSNTPDTVEFSSGNLTLRNVEGDAVSVTGELGCEEILAEGFPGDSVSPLTVPGVFVMNE